MLDRFGYWIPENLFGHYSPVHGKNSAVRDVLRDPADSMRTGKGMHLDGPFGRSFVHFVASCLLPPC